VRRPGRIGVLVAIAVAAAVLVVVGRLEKASASRAQVNGMARVLALVGPHWSTAATAYRLTPTFDCLLYRQGLDPYALELCFDRKGRVVETAHRGRTFARFWTLRYDPGASTLRVDRARLLAAFVAVGAARKGAKSIPLGFPDRGPVLAAPVTKSG
jgi:hypothetical protein